MDEITKDIVEKLAALVSEETTFKGVVKLKEDGSLEFKTYYVKSTIKPSDLGTRYLGNRGFHKNPGEFTTTTEVDDWDALIADMMLYKWFISKIKKEFF